MNHQGDSEPEGRKLMEDNQGTPALERDGIPGNDGESGQGLAEYALILAFVALAAVVALGALGTALANSDGFKIFDLI